MGAAEEYDFNTRMSLCTEECGVSLEKGFQPPLTAIKHLTSWFSPERRE